jgi:hypothetical protein
VTTNWKSIATILFALLLALTLQIQIASAASSCLASSTTAWTNAVLATQTAPFTATYDVTPSQNSMDGVVGFSLDGATGYSSLAVITRFSNAGVIDARNGGTYSAVTAVPYTAGLTYHFRLLINPSSKTYSVYVTPPGGSELTLATNYAFRSEQSTVPSLNNWSTHAEIGSLSVCNMAAGLPPTISTQPATQTVTAGQTATFTIAATGTAPLTYQWQKNGSSISGATSASYTTPAATTSDSGATFRAVVTNPVGSTTSTAAILTVQGTSCLANSTSTWTNTSFASQTGQFTATFDVTPSQNTMDGVVGFSLNAASAYSSLAVITRFSTAGVIDVRNAGTYSAATSVPYTAGLTYHFRLLINPGTKTYSVYVTPPSGSELTLATNYAFRSEQSTVSSLNNWTLHSEIGSLSLCNLAINTSSTPVAPTVSTQPVSQTVAAGQAASFTVAAAGTAPLTYQWQKNGSNIAGATSASYTTPATTTSDNGATFRAVVTNSAGSATSNAATLTVKAATAPSMQLSSSSISFGNEVVGGSLSQVLIISNTGTATLTISQVNETGSSFSTSGFSLPLTVVVGQQVTITLAFQPAAAGALSGSLSIVSNAPISPTTVALTGTGIAATRTLSISPTSLNFGNVTTGTSSASQTVTVTNTGNSNVAISQISVSGSEYSVSGGSTPVTLAPSQTLTLSVQFNATTAGSASNRISIVSNATGSPAAISLLGTGVAPVQHSVALTWSDSSSGMAGYNVYRSTVSGSSYTKVNSSLVGALNYTDTNVQSGTKYFYVTSAVDSSGAESTYSNEVSATVP